MLSSVSEVVRLTQDLVRIPTENPLMVEEKCSDFVYSWFQELHSLEIKQQQVEPGRINIIVRYPSSQRTNPPLVLLAHMDTVPVGNGWSRDPFQAEIDQGRMYGRGTADMKSGLAVVMMTMKHVVQQGLILNRDVYACITVDEEGPRMAGAVALVEEKIIPRDALIVAAEPTSLRLCTAHKGPMWYEITTYGKSAHAGNAHLGIDAGHAMSHIILKLKEEVNKLSYRHPIFGAASLSVGRLEGGSKTNMVMGSCRAEIDFRLIPPMTCAEANKIMQRVVSAGVSEVPGASAKVEPLGLERPPLETDPLSPLIPAFQTAYKNVMQAELSTDGFPAYTDAGIIALLTETNNCVVFGPGSLDQAHTVDEYIEVKQIEECEKIFYEMVKTFAR